MAPSDRLTNSPPPPMMLNHVEKSDFQMCLHARQPFIRYESHRRRPNSRIPSQGHVTKLPGVAALLRRHDAMQAKGLIASTPVPVPEHDFECWTPPRFAGTLSDNTASPKSRWTPLTAALETNPQTPLKSNWSSNTYRYESKTQQTWVAGTPRRRRRRWCGLRSLFELNRARRRRDICARSTVDAFCFGSRRGEAVGACQGIPRQSSCHLQPQQAPSRSFVAQPRAPAGQTPQAEDAEQAQEERGIHSGQPSECVRQQ